MVGSPKTNSGKLASPAYIDVPAVVLSLGRQYNTYLTPEQLYERTRGYWVMRPGLHQDVKYAMAFADGLVREVYRIESWSSAAIEDVPARNQRATSEFDIKAKIRWAFTGSVARDIRERFVGKSLCWNSSNAIWWINC